MEKPRIYSQIYAVVLKWCPALQKWAIIALIKICEAAAQPETKNQGHAIVEEGSIRGQGE